MSAIAQVQQFFERYGLVSSSCPDAFAEIISSLFPPYEAAVRARSGFFAGRVAKASILGFDLHCMSHAGHTSELVATDQGNISFAMTVEGLVGLSGAGREILEFPANKARLIKRRAGMETSLAAGTTTLSLGIPDQMFRAAVCSNYSLDSDDSLSFDPVVDLSVGSGRSLSHAMNHLLLTLLSPNRIKESQLLVSNFQNYVLSLLTGSLQGNLITPYQCSVSPAAPVSIKRAETFIRDMADHPITLADIAKAASCSERALQLAFRQYRNTTPMRHLRDVRLEEARKDLQNLEISVSDTALKWGFSGFGRFSRYYQERFGERPSETLAKNGSLASR